MGEIIGINLLAVNLVLDLMGIEPEERLDVIDQVNLVHDTLFPVKKKE